MKKISLLLCLALASTGATSVFAMERVDALKKIAKEMKKDIKITLEKINKKKQITQQDVADILKQMDAQSNHKNMDEVLDLEKAATRISMALRRTALINQFRDKSTIETNSVNTFLDQKKEALKKFQQSVGTVMATQKAAAAFKRGGTRTTATVPVAKKAEFGPPDLEKFVAERITGVNQSTDITLGGQTYKLKPNDPNQSSVFRMLVGRIKGDGPETADGVQQALGTALAYPEVMGAVEERGGPGPISSS